MSFQPTNNNSGQRQYTDYPSRSFAPPQNSRAATYASYMTGTYNNTSTQMNGDHPMYNGAPMRNQPTGFNPNAPSFQPRQQSNWNFAATSYGNQQQRPQRFDPFGYQHNRNAQPQTVNRAVHSSYIEQPPYGSASTQASANHYNHHQINRGPIPTNFPSDFHQAIQQRVGDNTVFKPVSNPQSSILQDSFDPEIAAYEAMYDFDGTSGNNQSVMIPLSPELIDQMHQSPNKQALFEIQVGLEQLISEPDNFDAWSIPIRDRITGKEITPDDRTTIAWLISEMAILAQNCQYNFAKLSQILSHSINGFAKDALVPQLIEFHVMSQNNPDYLTIDDRRNLLTFYAELYEKLLVNSQRIPALAQGTIEQIQDFLAGPLTDPIIKTVIHALKLCGRYLDADRHDAVDQIFSTFHDLIASRNSAITENGLALIKNVIVARGKHWGIDSEIGSNLASTASEAYDVVFYDPDGQPVILNDEELSFFEDCNRLEGANGVDDEIEAEYERFLQQQAEETALRTAEKALATLSVDDEDDLVNTSTDSKK